MDDDLTDVDPKLVPVLGAGVGPLYPVGAARHNDVTWLWVPEDKVMLGILYLTINTIPTGQSSGRR